MRNIKETLKAAGIPSDAAIDLGIAMDNIHKTLCRLDMQNRMALAIEPSFQPLFTIAEEFGRAEGLNAELNPQSYVHDKTNKIVKHVFHSNDNAIAE